MTRLIDADALSEKLCKMTTFIKDGEKFQRMINNAPTIEPDGDTISRRDAIRWVKTECNPYGKPTLDFESGKKVIEHLGQMPSAPSTEAEQVTGKLNNPDDSLLTADSEACKEQKSKLDLISRQDALAEFRDGRDVYDIMESIEELPSVQTGGDTISRQDAIDAMWKALYAYEDLTEKQFMEHEELELEDWFQHRIFVQRMHEECMKAVDSLPSAEPKTDEENELKFYYVESIDDYWIGRRLDNFYYADWHDGLGFVWSKSRYLPWGEHIVDENTLWKEHTYPSEPIEVPFAEWIVGFVKKYFAEPKTGEWMRLEREENVYDLHGVPTWGVNYMCDKCGFITTAIQDHFGQYRWCPSCGARMYKGGDTE